MITSKTDINVADSDVVEPTRPNFVAWDQFGPTLPCKTEQAALEQLVIKTLGSQTPYIVSKKYEQFGDQDPSVVLQLFSLSAEECERLANTIPPAWVKITARPDQHGTFNVWLLSRKRLVKLLASNGGINDE